MAKKTETLISQESLDELLNISEGLYDQIQDEEKDEDKVQSENTHLVLFAADLVPQKVDAVAWIIEEKANQIASMKEYLKAKKIEIERQEKAFERLKGFFAYVMKKHEYNTENRLQGKANALWYHTTHVVDDTTLDDIPTEYKTAKVTLPLEEWERVKGEVELVVTNKVEITVDKMAVKKAVEEGSLPGKHVRDKWHLSVGKALSKKKDEVVNVAPF